MVGWKRNTEFPFENGATIIVKVRCMFVCGKLVDSINDSLRHGEFGKVVAMDTLSSVEIHEIVTTFVVGRAKTNSADTALFVCVVGKISI